MNKLELFFAQLGEECGELQQIVGKSLRFGAFDWHPKTGHQNHALMRVELHDIIGVYQLACEEMGISSEIDQNVVNERKKKTIKYLEYSDKCGKLDHD